MSRSELRERAFNMYLSGEGRVTKKQIADALSVSPATVSRWAKQDGWDSTAKMLTVDVMTENLDRLLPKATAEILGAIKESTGEEILWQNILLQYAAIIRAQQLMDVECEEIVRLEKRRIEQGEDCAHEWENHTPWDRYKTFLDAQSKAMRALTAMLDKLDDHKRRQLINDELCARIQVIRNKVEQGAEDGAITVVSRIPREE